MGVCRSRSTASAVCFLCCCIYTLATPTPATLCTRQQSFLTTVTYLYNCHYPHLSFLLPFPLSCFDPSATVHHFLFSGSQTEKDMCFWGENTGQQEGPCGKVQNVKCNVQREKWRVKSDSPVKCKVKTKTWRCKGENVILKRAREKCKGPEQSKKWKVEGKSAKNGKSNTGATTDRLSDCLSESGRPGRVPCSLNCQRQAGA